MINREFHKTKGDIQRELEEIEAAKKRLQEIRGFVQSVS